MPEHADSLTLNLQCSACEGAVLLWYKDSPLGMVDPLFGDAETETGTL